MTEIQQLEIALNALKELTPKLKEKQHFEVAIGVEHERRNMLDQIEEITLQAERWFKYAEPHLHT